ncbi:MAG: hypothetical protein JRJ13_15130 [Deltaproteobacteria bacterium]|nr:hypothetical protein [Deltaproteobacteria bacterium]
MNTDTYKEIMSLSRMTVGELREKCLEALGGLTPAEHLMTNSPKISTYLALKKGGLHKH